MVPHFRDETYRGIETLGYNAERCIVQVLNARGHDVWGHEVWDISSLYRNSDNLLLRILRQFAWPPVQLNQHTHRWDVAVGQLLWPPVPGLAWTEVAAT
jgi:hypothetical protein